MTFSGSQSFVDTPTPSAGKADGLFYWRGRSDPSWDACRRPQRLEVLGHGNRKLDLHASVGTRRGAPRSSGARSHACRSHHLPSDFFARNSVCSNGCSCTIGPCCLLSLENRDAPSQAEQTDKTWGMAGEAAVAGAEKGRPFKPIYAASEPWDRYRRRHVRQGHPTAGCRWRIVSWGPAHSSLPPTRPALVGTKRSAELLLAP